MEKSTVGTRLAAVGLAALGIASVALVGLTAGVSVLDAVRFFVPGLVTAVLWAMIGPRLPQALGAAILGLFAASVWAVFVWTVEAFGPIDVLVVSAVAGVVSGSLAAASWGPLLRIRDMRSQPSPEEPTE